MTETPTPSEPTLASRLSALVAPFLPSGADSSLVGRNFGWMIGDRAFRLLVGLVVNTWLVRYLGAESLGLMSFAQSVVVITAVVSQLGLETILVRDLVRQPAHDAELMGTSLGLRVTGWFGTLGLALAVTSLLRPGDHRAMLLTWVFSTTALSQTLDIIEYWFQSRTRVSPVVRARLAAFVIAAIAKIVAIQLRLPLEGIAVIVAAEYALSTFALAVSYVIDGGHPSHWRWSGSRARQLLRDSWPLMLNALAVVVSVRVDQMIVTTLRGTAENGIYAAAQRLTEIVYYIPVAVMAAAGPVLLRSHQRSGEEYMRRLQRVFSLLALGALVITAVISLGAPLIVAILFGAAFRASGPVLAVQILAAPVLFLGVAQINWFIAEGRQRELMVRSVVAAAASVVMNLTLVPRLGALGASISMVVSQSFANWIFNAFFASTRQIFVMQSRALWPFRRW